MTEQSLPDESIFLQALEIQLPDERRAFLNQACGNNAALRDNVEALLRASARSGDLLALLDASIPTSPGTTEHIGSQIGRYKLLEKVGEGGMGVVYVAEQTEPVRRRVALKVIKPGMDTRQVIARFEAERQALAMMDHPNIAKIFDAGTTGQSTKSQASSIKQIRNTKSKARNESDSPDSNIGPSDLEIVCDLELGHGDLAAGRPYFVMELVRGLPITDYCDKAKLNPRQRLALLVDVCHAVQHAHQKGVIHRDLKPSNILITLNDGTPLVKVIDFGVAKAIGQQLTDRTVYTALTQLVGTPLYMSPEQAEMSNLDVDTRSDVYSLGVLLYELLTGTTPFDKDRLKNAGFDEMRRMIREDEPPRPSHRISTLNAEASSTISQQRGLDERHLGRVLRGELDWIVMKALEKDRTRRYESASALAADIQRYLSDEPVLACPPTTMYRFQKFARKHKPALATAAAITGCLILGTTVSAWQAARATTAEAQANANEQKAVANAVTAQEKEQEAIKQRDEVKALADKLAAKERELQQRLYASNMNLAKSAWDAGAIDRVQDLLNQHRPRPGETELRGFEWHYLHRQCHLELLTLKGHEGNLDRSIAFSPDGKRLASASDDGTAKVWDAQTGQELLSIKSRDSLVNGLAFSPDGKRLASAANEKGIEIWDAVTGQEVLFIQGHSLPTKGIAFSPDGKRLASCSGSFNDPEKPGEVKLWDAQTGQVLLTLKGHANGVWSIAFSPDGKRLASASSDETVKVWDAQSGQELLSLKGCGDSVAFSPDGRRLASNTSSDNTVKVWDAQTGQELSSLYGHTNQVNSVAFSPDSKRLASAGGDRMVRVWDAQTGQELFSLKGHSRMVSSVAFSPDGTRLASGSRDGTVKVWDATAAPEARTFSGHTDGVRSVAYSPDGKRLASASGDKTVKVWDVQSGQEFLSLKGHTASVHSVVFSPDGKRLASGSGDKTVKVWDAQTGQELLTCKGHTGSVVSVAFSPDSTRLVSSSGLPNNYDRSGDPGEPGEVIVWDAQTGQELFTLKGHRRFVNCVTFSPDGKRLATLSRDNTVKVWNAQTGQEILTLKSNTISHGSIAFSPDGKRLASSNSLIGDVLAPPGAGEVKVWDAQTGDELLTLKGQTSHISSVVFSPDGKRLASGDLWAKTVMVWDAQTGAELLRLKRQTGWVNSLAFSPDGDRLATNGTDGTVTIYDATPLPEKQP